MTSSQEESGGRGVAAFGPRFLWLVVQLALLLAVIQGFRIQEGFGFLRLLPLILGGFVVHALLPLRLRLPFFTLLSLASVGLVVPFPHSLTLVGIGLGLIGLCHLPQPFWVRVAVILVVSGFLARIRGGWSDVPGGRELETLVLPVIGAMFMYRLAVYLYDLRNEKQPATIWERVSYFFMLPNVCFLLFPVVDYSTYRRSHYKGDALETYQHGIDLILRGITHLVLYRLVYQYGIPTPGEIQGLADVALYVLATYLLYLRISGQFHVIVGILALFGFRLPETHRLYYLATSFNDFWRRINIYWKDYMLKLFFYPTFMRFRGLGMALRLTVATMIVFVCTWLLHSYQWFWIRGSFPVTAKDGIFWGVLGVLVIVNSLREAKGTRKSISKDAWSLAEAYRVSAKTLGTFTFICVLWSLWSAHSIEEWLHLMSKAGTSGAPAWAALALALVAVLHLGLLLRYAYTPGTPLHAWRLRWSIQDPRKATLLGCAVLLLACWPEERGGPGGRVGELLASLRADRLNVKDSQLAEQGYYEGLNDAGSFTSALWAGHTGKPRGREWLDVRSSNVSRTTGDLLEYEFIPSYHGTWKDAPFHTNRWGMRDRDYALAKPPATYRVALIGASMEVAAGVPADEVYEGLVEERLNREHAGGRYERFELLNFAVGGYGMVQKALMVRDRIPAFEPDLVVLTLHATEDRRLDNHLANVIVEGLVDEAFLADALEPAGLRPGMTEEEVRERLPAVRDAVLVASMRMLREACEANGIALFTVFLPMTDDRELRDPRVTELVALARAAGLDPVLVREAFRGADRHHEFLLEPRWDPLHLNVRGNRSLADALYPHLERRIGLQN